ncbi:ATP-grasp domain-containing protein [Paludisphaera borealis]|uniref:Cycloserine biosynthesis protein DcsG n=1 Tax=Paludisphaera borealis TaxID=1387353 RepID=A0A1U7CRN5_9BACT|nr:hypothetical protein [Paludisphaera borealis]APW61610.1 Cycloserine biosynthesis protein DcsG [Paludisphaera borealis]
MDILIATSGEYPELGPYDRGILDALGRLGLKARPQVWTDERADWGEARAVVIQSTWDYHLAPEKFLAWAEGVASVASLFNPPRLLTGNVHKRYLRDLERKGVAVTPTEWIGPTDDFRLGNVLRERSWRRAVVKPAVSAGANETYIVDLEAIRDVESRIARLAADHEIMVQPYLTAFETEGERSYVFIDGDLSHVVHRPPTLASAVRGFTEPHASSEYDAGEVRLAERAMGTLEERPLYARVDVATDNAGVARLQELELIEPVLFTSLAPGSVDRLARAISARL